MGMRIVVHLMGYELVLLFINRYRGGRVCYCKTEVGEVVVELYYYGLWILKTLRRQFATFILFIEGSSIFE